MGITAAVCFALTLFAFQTKWDFTVLGGALLCGVVVLLIFGTARTRTGPLVVSGGEKWGGGSLRPFNPNISSKKN